MAQIQGINNNLYSALFGGSSASSLYGNSFPIGAINTSTAKFKGNVTGYKPVGQNNQTTSELNSSDTKTYMAALKNFGNKLKDATSSLLRSGQSVFGSISGVSSKDEAMTVSVASQTGASAFNSEKASKNVTIQQLASTQENKGASMFATSVSGATAGTNQFTIEKGGKSYQFSVNVNTTDSSRTAQQKTADAINKANIGVKATVEYDDKTKKSTLTLASTETGAKNAFSIKDVENRGNLAATLGISQTTQEARDARYTVDGEEKSSSKNTVDLGDGLTGNLKKVTSEAVTVTTGRNVDNIANAVKSMVSNFNGLMEATQEYGSDRGAQALRQKMDSIVSSYATSLQRIGITRDKDGYLSVDSDKLKTAVEDGSAERLLSDNNAGFTQRLSQLAKSVDSDPSRYISYESRNSAKNEQGNADESGSNNPYQNSMSAYQSAWLSNIGLLFNTGV